jgi:hypothetical protein
MTRTHKLVVVSAVVTVFWANPVTGQDLSPSVWQCGEYTNAFPPADLGPTVVATTDVQESSPNFSDWYYDYQNVTTSQLVFSEQRNVFDNSGNVIGVTPIVTPSIDGIAEASYTATAALGAHPPAVVYAQAADAGGYVEYYGRIDAAPGAPTDQPIPITIQLRGYTTVSGDDVGGDTTHAYAASTFVSSQGSITGEAGSMVGGGEHDEYEKSLSVSLLPGEAFYCAAEAIAHVAEPSTDNWVDDSYDNQSFAGSGGNAEAFADPTIQIDPSFPNANLYSLEFSSNIPGPMHGLVPGDYNGNGIVDSGDYDMWKQSFGSTTVLVADGNNDGIVDTADYTVWRDHLGQTFGGGSGAASASAPEPTSFILAFIAVFALVGFMTLCCRRRHLMP